VTILKKKLIYIFDKSKKNKKNSGSSANHANSSSPFH